MKLKLALLVASLAFAGQAHAQTVSSPISKTPKPAPAPITAELQASSSKNGVVANAGVGSQVATGWNYVHATHCDAYYNGSTSYMYIYPQEGGYWFSSNAFFANVFANQCTDGNWIALYVTNGSTGEFNQVYTYDFK